MKGWPIVATILVTSAVAVMLALGFWQLQRKGEKEALLARYADAEGLPALVWPSVPNPEELPLYRMSALQCIKVVGWRSVSGTSADGKPGYAHLASCQTGGAEGPGATVAVGWSERPVHPDWTGGLVEGVIAPEKAQLIRLVATRPVAGLEPLAKPSPEQIPNNHLLYAIQWFIFAGAAAVIYILALQKRKKAN
ncbi:MAG: SURF1 family protein [Sphingorhabdus sp.]